MASQEQLDILKQGVSIWNQWRERNPLIMVNLSDASLREENLSQANLSDAQLSEADLRQADLSQANLRRADLSKANLRGANLSRVEAFSPLLQSGSPSGGANLKGANLSDANLSDADLRGVDFSEADLSGANLRRANLTNSILQKAVLRGAHLNRAKLRGAYLSKGYLRGADLRGVDFSEADLSGADLIAANLVQTNFSGANLTNCQIYGISVWDVQLEGTKQFDLVITPPNQLAITVDNLKIAQFIYLLLNNEEIRDIINTITTKVVLILGRFTPERKIVLDALRETLRQHNYLPILFDFEKPSSRNFTETVKTLAHLARFIIADLTDPSSIPQELQAIVPTLAIPVQPLLLEGKKEHTMFVDFLTTYPWVLPIRTYRDQTSLLSSLEDQIIKPAEQRAQELEKR